MTVNRDMRDTSNKDSAGWKKILPGQKNWSISVEALYNPAGTNNFSTLYTAWAAGTALTVTVKNGTQDWYWSGTCYITSLSMNAPNEGNASLTAQFAGDGALTQTDPLAS
jgi:predicted secreted protein